MRWYLGAIFVLIVALVFQLGLLAYAMYVLLGIMVVSRFGAVIGSTTCRRVASAIAMRPKSAIRRQWSSRSATADACPSPGRWSKTVCRAGLVQTTAAIEGPQSAADDRHAPPRRAKDDALPGGIPDAGLLSVGPVVLWRRAICSVCTAATVATEPHFVLVYPRLVPLVGYDLASRTPGRRNPADSPAVRRSNAHCRRAALPEGDP